MASKKSPIRKRAARSRETRLKIERQEVLKEVHTKSYEVVRLSRVKYFENDYEFIDLRAYQRGSGEDGEDIYYPTQRGVQLKEDLFHRLLSEHFLNSIKRRIVE